MHEYVSPVFQGTHQVSENTTLSLYLHTQISKNGAATDVRKGVRRLYGQLSTYQGNERLLESAGDAVVHMPGL